MVTHRDEQFIYQKRMNQKGFTQGRNAKGRSGSPGTTPFLFSWKMMLTLIIFCGGYFWSINGQASQTDFWSATPPAYLRELTALENPAQDPDPLVLNPLPEKTEDLALKGTLESVIAQSPPLLRPHLYYLNLKTGEYVDIGADSPVPAASVIKLPVLMDYLRSLNEGKLTLETPLRYDFIHQAGGSGELQYKPPGQMLPSYDIAKSMIQISDNTSTNILIDTLGGMDELNERMHRMGLTQTYLRNWLPDLSGTNVISPRDMSKLLYNIGYTNYFSPAQQKVALGILQGTHNNRLIPAGLPPKTLVFHKTGDIGGALGDSAIVHLPNSDYLLSLQVERPYNDYSAKTLMIDLSKHIYDYLQQKKIGGTSNQGTLQEANPSNKIIDTLNSESLNPENPDNLPFARN